MMMVEAAINKYVGAELFQRKVMVVEDEYITEALLVSLLIKELSECGIVDIISKAVIDKVLRSKADLTGIPFDDEEDSDGDRIDVPLATRSRPTTSVASGSRSGASTSGSEGSSKIKVVKEMRRKVVPIASESDEEEEIPEEPLMRASSRAQTSTPVVKGVRHNSRLHGFADEDSPKEMFKRLDTVLDGLGKRHIICPKGDKKPLQDFTIDELASKLDEKDVGDELVKKLGLKGANVYTSKVILARYVKGVSAR